MMRLFANMDLYKAIILSCVVLLPVAGAWAYYEHQQLKKGRKAIADAGNHIRKVALLKKEIEQQIINERRNAGTEDPLIYFERVVNNSVDTSKGQPLKKTDYQINRSSQDGQLRVDKKRVYYTDDYVDLTFRRNGREVYPLKRDFLNAVLFNAESQQRRWKLRELSVRNASALALGPSKPPPPEVDDEWVVGKLTFVWRRQTRTK